MTRTALLVLALGGCLGEDVTPPDIGDYTIWQHVTLSGEVPGHGNTTRIVYVNDVVVATGPTERGAIIVKEIYEGGAFTELELMRKQVAGVDPANEGGWLFTTRAPPTSGEVHRDLCWARCHRAAPFAGAWLDYTTITYDP
ncbi:MAG: hypothetical protein ACKV2T_33260 [Kofleriaceae bacterium]